MKSLEWMRPSESQSKYQLKYLDQTKLPREELYILTDDYRQVGEAIRSLSIRGAPAIGIAAAYAVALAAIKLKTYEPEQFYIEIKQVIKFLNSTRPTAVNLFWALDRMEKVIKTFSHESVEKSINELIAEAQKIHEEDIKMCSDIGVLGAKLIPDKAAILTHCNTGELATGGAGTAQSVITTAFRNGKQIKVYVDETRPLLQGARLTMWELSKLGLDVTLITDNTAGFLMQQKKIDLVITGADRITSKGFVFNKVGTYSLAALAQIHKIPFYIAAPLSSIDFNIINEKNVLIEERASTEVTEISGHKIAPDGINVYSPAFDLTPPEFVTAIITNYTILYPPYNITIKQLLNNFSS